MKAVDHRASGSLVALGCAFLIVATPIAAAIALVAWSAIVSMTP